LRKSIKETVLVEEHKETVLAEERKETAISLYNAINLPKHQAIRISWHLLRR
jgi:hypothetical protein